MQDETILYNPSTNEFYVLNATAAFLWKELEEPRTEDELASRVQASFADTDVETVAADVRETLRQFEELQILVAKS